MLVKIDEEQALTMLTDRVAYWTNDHKTICLFEDMYESYVYGGCFDGGEFDVMQIVDNDYVNYCQVVTEDEEDFKDILKVYREQGLGDCSCEDCRGDFIEAVDDKEEPTAFLIRV